jgi:amino-acid N-acetyltransferase
MIKKATMADAKEIHSFMLEGAKTGEILPRPLNDMYQFLRDYWALRQGKGKPIRAISSLHVCWHDLGEIRNLYVDEKLRGKGIGESLVKLSLDEAKTMGLKKVFALTYRPGFFERLGFRRTKRQNLPSKIWADCLSCMKFPDCDETAVIFELGKDRFRYLKTRRK